MSGLSPIPATIDDRLKAFARRQRQVALLRAAAEALLIFIAALILTACIEVAFRPGQGWRVALSTVVYLASLGAFVWRGLIPACRNSSRFEMARALEQAADGRLRERLMTAVEFAEAGREAPGISPWMVAQTIELAEREAAGLNPVALVDTTPLRRLARWALVAGAATVILGLVPWTGPLVRLALYPFGPATALARTQLEVTPGDTRVRLGEAVDIRAAARPWPDASVVDLQWEDGFKERLAMSASASTHLFALRIPAIAQPLRYRILAGDAETRLFQVEVDAPPRLDRVRLEIKPPAHTGWATRQVAGGDADVLTGSRVRIVAQLGGAPTERAWLRVEARPDQPLPVEDQEAALDLAPTNSFSYAFKLEGRDGLVSEPTQHWSLRVMPDQPPVVALSGDGLESAVVGRDELVLLKAEARDDVGLRSLHVVSVLNGTNEIRQALPLTPDNAGSPVLSAQSTAALDLLARRVELGDELQVRIEATDLAGQIGTGGPVNLLVSHPDLARMAQFAARLREQLLVMDIDQELLRETRSSWFALSRSREADSEDVRRDLRLLLNRVDQLRSDLRDVGERVGQAARTAGLPVSPVVAVLGANISAWGEAQNRVLRETAEAAQAASGTNRADAFTRGRDLFDGALTDFGRVRRHLATATLALESEVLAARSEAAQGRYKRALPIVRVSHGLEASMRRGLYAEFFAGLTKSLVFRTNDLPRIDNLEVPGHGRANWSVRYTGELYIPDTGPWTVAAVADDGVRLQLDGRVLTPPEAWRQHPATEYRTNVTLTAGWHPIVLEMYQAAGESKLRLLLGREGRPLNEVPGLQLRSPANEMRDIERQVAALPKEALRQADERAVASLGTVAPVPETIAVMTNDVPLEGLVRLAAESRAAGTFVRANGPRLTDWTLGLSYDVEARGDALVSAARDARNLLRGELDQLRWKVRGPEPLRALRIPMEALRESSEQLREIARANKSRAGKRAAQEREAAQAAAWARELSRAADQLDDRFFDRAREDGHHLTERAQDLIASTRLEREVGQAAAEIDETVTAVKRSPEDMASRIQQSLDRIERALNDVNRAVEVGQQGKSATLATEALRQNRALANAQGDPVREAQAYAQMRETVTEVAQTERARGNQGGAEAMERALSNAPANVRLDDLANQLRNVRNAIPKVPESVASLPAPPMREQARALKKDPEARDPAAEALAKPRLALAVEAERARRHGDPALGNAYQRLGRDVGSLLQKPEAITSPKVDRLADRAEALAGARGGEARQREIAEANRTPASPEATDPASQEAASLAQRLGQLSTEAGAAAGEAKRRPALMSGLDELAALPLGDSAAAASATSGDASQSSKLKAQSSKSRPSTRAVAAGAAGEASGQIRAAPKEWNAYKEASQTLADAAEQLRLGQAGAETAEARPPCQEPGSEAGGEQPGLAQKGPSSPTPGSASAQDSGSTERPVGDATGLASSARGEDQAEWARLAARLRQSVRSTGIEHFSEEQQEAIRAYYRRLGEGR